MVKFDKPIETKCVSEYIASKLARVLGIECQEVTLGTYKNCKVCVIELFTKDDEIIHHFYDINDSSVSGAISRDVRDLPYSLDYIISIISNYKNINIPNYKLIDYFVDMTVFDYIIGNFDRHWGNWGFIETDKKYRLTPLFDNGSSLLPKLSEEEIGKCLDKSKNEVSRYITDLPKSQIRSSKNKRYNYIQLIKDICELGYRDRVLEILSRITETDIISVFSDKYLSSFIRQDKLEVLKIVTIKRYRLLKEELDCR